MQKKIRMYFTAESGYCRGIKSNAVFESTVKFPGHYRNVFLPAENVAERKAYKLNVLLLNILLDLFF